ncbi:MAG: YhfC family intramembrane metalloprotease [Euryarchaeota archaeon]|nr:YhfC family intramembrane metalloprotease [Euryarchaeota archaeon]
MVHVFSAFSLVLGGIIAVILVLVIFKPHKLLFSALFSGAAAFLIAIFIQSPIQQIPLLILGIRTTADIIIRGTTFVIIISFYTGFIAAIFQEIFKYLFLKKENSEYSLQVGLGFGITEVIYLAIYAFMSIAILGSIPENTGVLQYIAPGIERFLVLLFHTLTAIYMELYGIKGLMITTAAHGAIDSLATCVQLYIRVIGYDMLSYLSILVLYFSMLALDILLLRISLPLRSGSLAF